MYSATARMQYQNSAKAGRVISANGHQLITILFDELLDLLDEICVIHSRGKGIGVVDQQVMALTIIDSLLESLDMEKGGNVALSLQNIYLQVRKLLESKDTSLLLQNAKAAHQVISEIASAWREMKV